MLYKHTLFFDMITDAEDAQTWVAEHVDNADYSFLYPRVETGTVEFHFYTAKLLSKKKRLSLLNVAPVTSHAFNVEE